MPALPYPDPPLGDGLVALRPWRLADLKAIVKACQDPEISRFSPVIPRPYSDADARGWLLGQEPARLAGEALDLAICAPGQDAPLGAIGVHQVSLLLGSCAIGYWVAAPARGRGLAAGAARLLCGWLLGPLGMQRIELTTDPENLASQRVAQRCGFVREGVARSHMRVRHSGQRRDSVVFSLLGGELRG